MIKCEECVYRATCCQTVLECKKNKGGLLDHALLSQKQLDAYLPRKLTRLLWDAGVTWHPDSVAEYLLAHGVTIGGNNG